MGALKRSWYGLVEIDPPNDQIVLQAHSSQQDYSKRPKDIYAQIELSEQGSSKEDFLTKNNKWINRC